MSTHMTATREEWLAAREPMLVYCGILDRTPRGRDEGDPADPSWIRRHDEHEAG